MSTPNDKKTLVLDWSGRYSLDFDTLHNWDAEVFNSDEEINRRDDEADRAEYESNQDYE